MEMETEMDLDFTDDDKRAVVSYHKTRQFFIDRIKDSCKFDDPDDVPWVRGWFGDVFGKAELYSHVILIIPEAAYGYSYFTKKLKIVPKRSLPTCITIPWEEAPLQILAQVAEVLDAKSWPRANVGLPKTCMYCGRTDRNMVPHMTEGLKMFTSDKPNETTGWNQGSFKETFRDNHGTLGREINCIDCTTMDQKSVHWIYTMRKYLSEYLKNKFEVEVDRIDSPI